MKNLCSSCRHGQVMEFANGTMEIHCEGMNGRLSQPIVTCSQYRNRTETRLSDMESVAWVLETSKKGEYGFVPYHAWAKRHPGEDLVPGRY